ncbi:hypothetical protein SK128_006507, partial [Halocaridina rubra]
AEMISQGAQTNGDAGRRKLVKSFSEAARYEGIQYEIYDLDDLTDPPQPYRAMSEGPPLPCPLRFSAYEIPLEESPPLPPLKFRQNYHEIFIDASPQKPRRGLLQKTLSEGEILSERRKALSLASGYMEVDINGFSDNEEEVIEPQCVDQCSIDLSRSRIFSPDTFLEEEEEFHENMFHKDILPPALLAERKMSQVSTDSDLKTYDPNEFRTEEHLRSQLVALSLDSLADGGPSLVESVSAAESYSAEDGTSMPYLGTPTDAPSFGEFGDHFEESMSESQITVVQRALAASSQVIASDSENGSFHLTDPSSAATTPSTRHKSLPTGGSFEEDLDDELLPRLRVSNIVHSATTLSSIEDEQTSISENVISDGSQGCPVSTSTTSSEFDKAVASSTDDFSSIRSGDSMTIKSETLEEEEFDGDIVIEENIMARLVQDMKDSEVASQLAIKTSDFKDDARKLASPESDSSSSHFTEQETSRSPVSGTTNTMTSKSDLSRTDSHHTDQSETSEDYITANESSNNGGLDTRRSYSFEERHVSSPPDMDDIIEDEALTPKILSPETSEVHIDLQEHSDLTEGLSLTSDFETALTSPDGDTTTSASYYIDHSIGEESDKITEVKFKPEVPPKPAFLPKPEVPPKPDRWSPSRERSRYSPDAREGILLEDPIPPPLPEFQDDIPIKVREKSCEESKTGAIKKRYSGGKVPKDDNKRYSKYYEDNDKGEIAEVHGESQKSWSEEDREKAKQTMKLDFPPGVTMFGEAPNWPEHENLKTGDVEKKLKIFDKPKKSVKIDLASVEDIVAAHCKSESPPSKEKGTQSNESQPVSAKREKAKRKTEEVTTPGMVRSPAMHEGFRLEDWTPVRTPGTPDRALDLDTSDESYSEGPRLPPKARSPGRRSKELPSKKAESPGRKLESPEKQSSPRQSPRKSPARTSEGPKYTENWKDSPEKQSRHSPIKTEIKQLSPERDSISSRLERSIAHTVEVHQRQSPSRYPKAAEARKRLSESSISSVLETTELVKRHSTEVLGRSSEVQEYLKPSGVVTGYLRAGSQSPTSRERPLQLPESKLLTIAQPKDSRSAESLRSLSPGSDNVFLGGSREQLDEESRPALCIQCGERPASREGLLRPTSATSPNVTIERRLSDREPPRNRIVNHRAKSEERSSFGRDWGVTPVSLELGDNPRHDSDDDEKGVNNDAYHASPWLYVTPHDEAKVWRRDEGSPVPVPFDLRISGFEDEIEDDEPYEEEHEGRKDEFHEDFEERIKENGKTSDRENSFNKFEKPASSVKGACRSN